MMTRRVALLLPWREQAATFLAEGKPLLAEAHLRAGLHTVAAITGGAR